MSRWHNKPLEHLPATFDANVHNVCHSQVAKLKSGRDRAGNISNEQDAQHTVGVQQAATTRL